MLEPLARVLLPFDGIAAPPQLENGAAESVTDAPGQVLGVVPGPVIEDLEQFLGLGEFVAGQVKISRGHRNEG
mgnify:CR=1 FL=1